MDKISHLSDDLLIKILSLVSTKDAVAMSVLSKRWMSLWKLVPRLVYEDYSYDADALTRETHWRNLSHFVYGTLLFHKASVLETFHLNLGSGRHALETDIWIRIAVERFLRDLKISFYYNHGVIRLPSSLYSCETLVTLELHMVIVSEIPSRCSFRSLKTLHLLSLKYSDEESFVRLISSCPVLEDLVIESCGFDNVATFTVNVPSLQSLIVRNTSQEDGPDHGHSFVIHSHSLKMLNILDPFFGEVNVIGHMPELVVAELQTFGHHENVLKSLTYVKRLSLCLGGEAQFLIGSVFFQLVRLELCMCLEKWSSILVYLLQHSPKLQILKLVLNHTVVGERKVCWIQPSCVPECLVLHLKTFECTYYDGFEEENEVAIYILKNARRLVTATIDLDSPSIDLDPVKLARKLIIFEALESETRGSRTCELIMGGSEETVQTNWVDSKHKLHNFFV